MTLSDIDRGRLDKVIDFALQFAPDMKALARARVGKEIMKISNERDFVFGGFFSFVMAIFVFGRKSETELSQDEVNAILTITMRRFLKEVDSFAAKETTAKKQRKRKSKLD